MNHFVTKCTECSAVISQCRCPDPNKEVRHGKCAKCSQAPEPTQSPAKPGSNSSDPKYLPWEWKLKHFLQNQHGSAGWEMKLENLVGMLREEAHAAGEKEGIDKCLGKLEIGTKSTKELFPYAVQAPTEEWALLCIEKDAYNRGVKDAEQALKSLLPLDTNNPSL